MPHCVLWEEGDWAFARDTVLLHAAFVRGDLRLAPELRLRGQLMGMTLPSRRDLRIRYVDPPSEDERKGVAALSDYKERLQQWAERG
jgi:hypothetical protein